MSNNVSKESEVRIDYKEYKAEAISETLETKDGKETYVTCSFGEVGDVITQSRDYKKVFFEDTHSRAFRKAEEAREDNTVNKLRIMAAKVNAQCDPYYVIINGKRQERANGDPVIAEVVSLFLLPDEKFITEYKRALRNLEFVDTSGEGEDNEETKAAKLAK